MEGYAINININDLVSSKLVGMHKLATSVLSGIKQAFGGINANNVVSAVSSLSSQFDKTTLSVEQLEAKIALLTQKRNSIKDLGLIEGVNKEISAVQRKIAELRNLGNSVPPTVGKINQLQEKINLLAQKRDADTDLGGIKGLNREISKAQKELEKLKNLGNNVNPLTNLKNSAMQAVPALGLVANPIVATTLALGTAVTTAMSFEQGMAKINSTLQVGPDKLKSIKDEMLALSKTSNVDLNQMPSAFEKIVSAVGDADKSMAIFKSSLKAAQAGFTDVNVVADAGAAIMANYSGITSDYAMDVLMKTKNLGKAEFGDLAKYMPQILPDAKRLGISFEEMGASFAYFTSKGIGVEQTTTYLKNMMKPLGDPDKIENLEKLGVKVFEIGEGGKTQKRPLLGIFSDLQKVLGKMNEVQKLEAFKKLELDMEAGAGFSASIQDIKTYSEMMLKMKNASGETNETLKFTGNTANTLTQFTNNVKRVFLELGDIVLPYVNSGLVAVNASFSFIKPVVQAVGTALQGVANVFMFLQPIMSYMTPIVVGLTSAYVAYSAVMGTMAVVQGITNIAVGTFNALMALNPVTRVVLAVVALTAGLVYLYNTFEPFKDVVDSVFGYMQRQITGVTGMVMALIEKIREGLQWLGILSKEDKKVQEEKDKKNKKTTESGIGDIIGLNDILAKAEKDAKIATEKEAKEKQALLGTGKNVTAFMNNPAYMSAEQKKGTKGDKLSLGTFGVEGDSKQAKILTVNIQTLGGIQNVNVVVDDKNMATTEMKQKLQDAVREALINSVRDFELNY